jgi:hypothetical protein
VPKIYALPSKILVAETLVKWEVLDWLSRNIGIVHRSEDPQKPIHSGEGWRFIFTYRFASINTRRTTVKIEFDDSVPDDIILYFLLRFGDSI